jgi:hypothetical protein
VAALYVALMLAILLSLDPAFFYPRIETDQLLYLLKAKALVETGSTKAFNVVNAPPFAYAAMPGVLRAPFMLAFDDFDQQLRGMQVMNVAIVAMTAIMSACVLSWALPKQLHKAAIVFSFAFVVLSPDWLTNTFVPLADAPYAMLTLACLLIAVSVMTSGKPVTSHVPGIAAFATLFAIAFMVRFTAPVLFVAVALLARGRWKNAQLSQRARRLVIGIPLGALLLLVVLNAQAIFGKYITEPFHYIIFADKTGIGLNLFGASIPSQIVPVFNLGFQLTPPSDDLRPAFGTTPRDAVWTALGLLISGIAALGLVRASRRFLPEIAYFLVVLPVLGVMIPSTTRYLMSYQPIIWICFASGISFLAEPVSKRLSAKQVRILAAAGALAGIAGLVGLRTATTARTAAGAAAASPLERPVQYAAEVASTFRRLREFVEGLPADRALLVSVGAEAGRWYVISGRRSYLPDSTMTETLQDKDLYSILSCGTPVGCEGFDRWQGMRATRLRAFGDFEYEKVFEYRTGSARAEVHRISTSRGGN